MAFMVDEACDYLLALAASEACPMPITELAGLHGHSPAQAARRVGLLTSTRLALPAGPGMVMITALGREGARLRRGSGR